MEQMEQIGILERGKVFTPITAARGISWAEAECLQVRAEDIAEVWHIISGFIADWLTSQDYELTLGEIRAELDKGLMQAFVVHAGGEVGLVSLTQFIQYTHKKALRFVGTAGRNPLLIAKFMPSVELWAKANGATLLETFASPAIVKLDERLGFKTKTVFMEKEL